MRRSGRRGEGRGRRESGPGELRQLPWATVENRFPPLEPLDGEQLETIHLASLRILEEQGIEVDSADARRLFREAGADVDDSSGMVRLDRSLLLEKVALAPQRFTLTPRNPDRAITVGGSVINFGLVSGPPNVHDRVNGRRPGNFDDYCTLMKLGQAFNVVGFFGNQALAPIDLPANRRHLDTYRAALVLTDKVFSGIPIGAGRARDAVEMIARARGMTLEQLREQPATIANINVNSPRKLDHAMAAGAMQIAALGQAVIVTPFTLLGAMTPVTLAAGLAQQNAEALFGIALVQLARPGNPVVYGGFTSNVDMRSGAPAFGTPENAQANLAGGQLARRYRLPYRSSACNASNVADAQAVYETQAAMWTAVLGHANLVYHAAGWLEGGLTASFEKLVLDVEMIQTLRRILAPVAFTEEDLGIDAIAAIPPGGHFFGSDHTMSRYADAFYDPLVSDWQNQQAWQEAGSRDATARATAVWQQVLREFQPPELAVDRLEAIDDYVARRRQEIGDGEP